MHIPDGFLNIGTLAGTAVFSAGGLAYSLKKSRETFKDKSVPLMGVAAAFVFAAQMLNFPVVGGTSGHLLGGVLSAALLGPWGGMVVISSVLIVQCLIFQDGGLLALSANIFNMGIMGTMGGYLLYAGIRKMTGNFLISTGIAAWASVVFAASFCAAELALSGTSPIKIVLPAMAGIHALIGVGEAVITATVLSLVRKVRPDIIYEAGA